MIERQVLAHKKVVKLIDDKYFMKKELAERLKLKYGTFYNRYKSGKWSLREIKIIEKL
jgi:hypothetical protein